MSFLSHTRIPRVRGFTLIEVLVSVFIFMVIMAAISQLFTSAFAGYRYAKTVQRDVENAQFALNLMAKELRTSSVVSASGIHSSVKFFDYSQSMCLEYAIASNQLTVAKRAVAAPTDDPSADCSGVLSAAAPIVKSGSAGGTVTGVFVVTPSKKTPQSVGKVTVSLQISEGPGHMARIQTTSSLRDYGYIGL